MATSQNDKSNPLCFVENVEKDLSAKTWRLTGQMRSHIRSTVVKRLQQSRAKTLQFKHVAFPPSQDPCEVEEGLPGPAGFKRFPRRLRPQIPVISDFYPPPATILNPGNRDPFDTCVLELDPFAVHLLNLIVQYHFSMIWPIEFCTQSQPQVICLWQQHLRDSIGNQTWLAGFLALGAVLKQHVHRKLPNDTWQETRTRADHYKSIAISGLANAGSGMPTLPQLICTTNLACLEAYSQNITATKIYYKAVGHMAKTMNNLDEWMWVDREYVLAAIWNISMILQEQPMFPVADHDPGPIIGGKINIWCYSPLVAEIDLRSKLQSNRTGKILKQCDAEVRELVSDLQELFAVEDARETWFNDSRRHNAIFRWMHNRMMSCHSRLYTQRLRRVDPMTQVLAAAEPHSMSSSFTTQDDIYRLESKLLNACLILGASFAEVVVLWRAREQMDKWNIFLSWEHDIGLCMVKLSEILNSNGSLEDPDLVDKLHVLLWATSMVASAQSMSAKVPTNGTRIYRDALTALMRRLHLRTFDELKSVCQRILWADETMSLALHEILDTSNLV